MVLLVVRADTSPYFIAEFAFMPIAKPTLEPKFPVFSPSPGEVRGWILTALADREVREREREKEIREGESTDVQVFRGSAFSVQERFIPSYILNSEH
jgi:hypothetical protein